MLAQIKQSKPAKSKGKAKTQNPRQGAVGKLSEFRHYLAIYRTFGLVNIYLASEEKARINQRFAVETPDFLKDVVPMLGKLGCNGRACHRSFQGQGEFGLLCSVITSKPIMRI